LTAINPEPVFHHVHGSPLVPGSSPGGRAISPGNHSVMTPIAGD
jgi:CRISPR/Cas system CSM-associated protein Csm3 (group 7 of RAMP superfamily)